MEVRLVGVDFAAFDLTAADGRCGLVQGLQFTAEYALAVEEGATMVRIGTALFGPRERPGSL